VGAYVLKEDLERRLSVEVVKQIFDDENSGVADADPIEQIILDAESVVNGYLRGTYTLPITSPPRVLKTISLDLAHALAHERHPEYVRASGKEQRERAMGMLRAIRKGEMRLDVEGSPEPGSNHGGAVETGNPYDPIVKPKIFADGTGDF
jgi:phage gp36-like protein